MAIDIRTKRAARQAILKLLYQKHERQEHRYDDKRLLAALDDLSFFLYTDVLHELLQDLKDRGYLIYVQEDKKAFRISGERTMWDIQLTPKGQNIVEGLEKDPAIGVD